MSGVGDVVVVGVHDFRGAVADGMEVAEHLPAVVVPGQLLHDSVWEFLLGLDI